MYGDVSWLSQGNVLSLFCSLKCSVLNFSTEINEFPEKRELLTNSDWLNDLDFLVDITGHLNALNHKLQGSNSLFTKLCNDDTSCY
jgi:hypothetical protein